MLGVPLLNQCAALQEENVSASTICLRRSDMACAFSANNQRVLTACGPRFRVGSAHPVVLQWSDRTVRDVFVQGYKRQPEQLPYPRYVQGKLRE